VTVTGFEMPAIDLIIEKAKASKPEDEVQPIDRTGAAVTRPGDLWRFGSHRILCADALKMASYATLMGEELARIAFADPPYNVKIAGFVSQSARLAHREFAMAVGEMTEDEFIAFLRSAIACARRFSVPGAVQFWCQDWRHQYELLSAARAAGLEQLDCCVWVKDNGGMGGFIGRAMSSSVCSRFRAPLIATTSNPASMAATGPTSGNTLARRPSPRRARRGASTSCIRPSSQSSSSRMRFSIARVATTSCSIRFWAVGSTLMAVERTGRTCRGIEIDPLYVDIAIRRWQRMTGEGAIHAENGRRLCRARA
jgi:DNA modification methylase